MDDVIRVGIIAGSPVLRAGLEAMLREDLRFAVVPQRPANGMAEPDVWLVDSPEEEKLARIISGARAPVVLLADDLGRARVRQALQNGVRSVLGREASAREIAAAVVSAAAGLTTLGAEQMDALLPAAELSDESEMINEPLTAREIEVLELLAEGTPNKEIARRLSISEHTVKFHVSSILGKLGAATRTEAVARGYREGLILM